MFKVDKYEYKGDLSQNDQIWQKIQEFQKHNQLTQVSHLVFDIRLQEEAEVIKLISNLVNGVTEM